MRQFHLHRTANCGAFVPKWGTVSRHRLAESPSANKINPTGWAPCSHVPGRVSATQPWQEGVQVQGFDLDETYFLQQEVWTDRCYLRHGIQLMPGGVVLDVGANIGIFTLQALMEVGPSGKVISCEPIPTIHQRLTQNVASLQEWCEQQGCGCGESSVINAGCSDGLRSSATFTFYRKASGWSSMYPDDSSVAANMGHFLTSALPTLKSVRPSLLSRLGQVIVGTPGLSWLFQLLWPLQVKAMLQSGETVTCSLLTVSDVIQMHGLKQVDLLKVDVERAEMDVLRGVSRQDWELIQQVVMEVHDVAGTLDEVQQLLRAHRLSRVVVEQPPEMKGTDLYMVYATRDMD